MVNNVLFHLQRTGSVVISSKEKVFEGLGSSEKKLAVINKAEILSLCEAGSYFTVKTLSSVPECMR